MEIRAALAELAGIDDPRLRRDAALALLEEFGGDLEGIEQIAAALAPTDGLNFTFDAIALTAARDPREAIAMAIALENPAAQTEAINRIAAALVASDPRAALGNVSAIANFQLADSFRTAVLEEWAADFRSDEDAVRLGFDPDAARAEWEPRLPEWNAFGRRLFGAFRAARPAAAGRDGSPARGPRRSP